MRVRSLENTTYKSTLFSSKVRSYVIKENVSVAISTVLAGINILHANLAVKITSKE